MLPGNAERLSISYRCGFTSAGENWPRVIPCSQPEKTVEDALPLAPENWSAWFTPGKFVCLLFLLVFALYPEVILGTHSFFDRDFGLFTYPAVKYAGQSIARGEWPLWNPLSNCGIPFLAQWNTTVCYPVSWLCFVLPLPYSLNCFCLAHLFIAGLGMYWLAFHWTGHRFAACIAGLVYALNGLMFNCLMWSSNLAALSWLPLVVLLAERAWREGGRGIIAAGMVAAVQMLAGAPEIILATWLILGTLWLGAVWRTPSFLKTLTSRLAGVIALVCGLTAMQLLPFFELVKNSDRKVEAANGAWSMPSWGLANFLVPLFRCVRTRLGPYIQIDQQWTSSYYIGIGAIALALLALFRIKKPRVWWLGGLALLGLLIALGKNGPLYGIIIRIFPRLAFARYPIKFIVPTIFAVPLLSAFAFGWIDAQLGSRRAIMRKTLLYIGAGLSVLVVGILLVDRFSPLPDESWPATWRNGLERVAFLGLLLAGATFHCGLTSIANKRRLGVGILLVLGFDSITHTARQNPTVPNRAYGPLDLQMTSTPRLGVSRAMVSPRMNALLMQSSTADSLINEVGNRRSLFEDSNLIDGVPKVNGFFSLYLREQSQINSLLYNPTNLPTGLMDFLGVSQLSSSEAYWQWNSRTSALPLVTAGARPFFAGETETLSALAKPDFNARKIVYLPAETRSQTTVVSNAQIEVLTSNFGSQNVQTEVVAREPALVVVAQTFYPEWKAFVDGRPAQILRANHSFQAVEVSAGRHNVRLVYHDRMFQTGLIISGFTFLLSGFCWVWRLKTRTAATSMPAAAPRP